MGKTDAPRSSWATRLAWDERIASAIAPCGQLELVRRGPSHTRADLADLGLRGLQFGSWDGRQPFCLNTDIVGLQSGDLTTENGHIYRVDDHSYFIRLDARERLPFAARSFSWIYAEHMIEHLDLMDAMHWLREIKRVLQPGGLVRLTTPDLRKYMEAYVRDDGFFDRHRERLQNQGIPLQGRSAFMVNQIFQFYGHKWIYDLDELRYVLGTANFATAAITECSFRQGAIAEVAELDREFRREETVYVEAVG